MWRLRGQYCAGAAAFSPYMQGYPATSTYDALSFSGQQTKKSGYTVKERQS